MRTATAVDSGLLPVNGLQMYSTGSRSTGAWWRSLVEKTGALMRRDYDRSDEVRALPMPVMLVFGDADGVPPAHAAEFFALLGRGRADGGRDRSGVTPHRLAVLPGATHHEMADDPRPAEAVLPFLE